MLELNYSSKIERRSNDHWFCRFRYLKEMGLAEREAEMQELETPRPERSRDLFGVQLEVIFITIFLYKLLFYIKNFGKNLIVQISYFLKAKKLILSDF